MKPRYIYLSLIIGLGLPCLAVVALMEYFFSLGYDVPFRIQGHAEKNLYMRDRAFALSPDGTRIVYASLETGKGDLYVMDADGHNIRRLTSSPEYESAPCFSPDGRWLLFCRETNKCGHIWRMALDGTQARQLTFGPDYDTNPLYAVDGQHIWFERTPLGTYPGAYDVFNMTMQGQKITPLNPTDQNLGKEAAMDFVHHGVYYTCSNYADVVPHHIWHIQADLTGKHLVIPGRYPAVSLKADRMVYVSGPWLNEVWSVKSNGSQSQRVYASQGNKHWPCVSPDGRQIFFLEETSHGACICRSGADGSDYQRLCELITWIE